MYSKNQTVKTGIRIFAASVLVFQAVFSIIWIYFNIGKMPVEHFSKDYLTAADTLVVDEYLSILYALILRVISRVTGTTTCLFGVLFVLQFLAVFFSAWTLPVGIKTKILVGLYIITNPLVLAGIGSVNVYAFAFATLFAGAGLLASCKKEIKAGYLTGFFFCSLISILLLPDILWFEAILLVPTAFVLLGVHGKRNIPGIVLWLMSAVVAMTINLFVPVPGAYGRAAKSSEIFLLQYFPGRNMVIYEDVLDNVDECDLTWVIRNLENYDELFIDEFGRRIESVNTKEDATAFYRYLISDYIGRGKKAPLLETVKWVSCYAFPTFALPILYYGRISGTHIPWVISNFIEHYPKLSVIYIFFGTVSGIILSLAELIGGLATKEASKRRRIYVSLLTVVILGVYCVFCNYKGFDYRLCTVAIVIFPVLLIIDIFNNKLNQE